MQNPRNWTIWPRSGMIADPRILKMGAGLRAVSILSIVFCLSSPATTIAADSKTDLDTINQQKVAGAGDPEKEIYDQVNRAVEAWNRHDLDGYLDGFWRSDSLILVVEGETVRGWDLLSKALHTGYPNPTEMGNVTLDRVQVQMLSSDLALALTWDTVSFPKKKEFGTSTIVMKKLPEGWRVAVMHTSFVEP
jgi:uncharacterized protein (TIGR02246 family)